MLPNFENCITSAGKSSNFVHLSFW